MSLVGDFDLLIVFVKGKVGQGQPFRKDIANAKNHSNCYNYSAISRKVILKTD